MQNMVGCRPVYVEILPKYMFSLDDVFVIFCLFEVFQPLTLIFGSPKVVKSFQSNLFDHKLHTEHILYSYIARKHQFWQPTFSLAHQRPQGPVGRFFSARRVLSGVFLRESLFKRSLQITF